MARKAYIYSGQPRTRINKSFKTPPGTWGRLIRKGSDSESIPYHKLRPLVVPTYPREFPNRPLKLGKVREGSNESTSSTSTSRSTESSKSGWRTPTPPSGDGFNTHQTRSRTSSADNGTPATAPQHPSTSAKRPPSETVNPQKRPRSPSTSLPERPKKKAANEKKAVGRPPGENNRENRYKRLLRENKKTLEKELRKRGLSPTGRKEHRITNILDFDDANPGFVAQTKDDDDEEQMDGSGNEEEQVDEEPVYESIEDDVEGQPPSSDDADEEDQDDEEQVYESIEVHVEDQSPPNDAGKRVSTSSGDTISTEYSPPWRYAYGPPELD